MNVLTPRLAAHRLLATTDLDEAREGVAGELCPHDLFPRGRWAHDDDERGRGGFSLRHHRAPFAEVALHWIDYGSDVEVRVAGMPFWLVQVPLAGAASVDDGGGGRGTRRGVAVVGSALVCGPGSPWRMRYAPGTPRVMLQVPSALVHRRREMAGLAGLAGRATAGAGIAPVLDLTTGAGAAFRRLLDVALDDVEALGSAGPVPLATRSLAVALVDSLISAQHAASGGEEPGALRAAANRSCVARAVRYVEEHCDEPLTTADIAAAVGVGVRALQAGYAQHLGETPMAHLRTVRLHRVREDLSAGAAESVTEAAARWGLTHLGRLSVQYREAFGESPSATLRRTR
ncbi:transcriptional regulator, AraC family [Quadrisphaera granulorum]|uniref:AraC family transcriptional regulator n=1 Tax=Quadrisphaera granulorum TaxID=317664 RepID=A0A316A9K9_9ACTN|nr:AraC family transcriptional regulator [Quadrisphaera granulorum]PWJ53554.1 AraC family transcriptional regulator [Quadrisphaera granulorum]SZE96896.1 transcriptional regulator, AraC family [Quadrisphaera granulorum]